MEVLQQRGGGWIVNDVKLSLAAELFVSVAPFPSELTSKIGGAAEWGFLADPLGTSKHL